MTSFWLLICCAFAIAMLWTDHANYAVVGAFAAGIYWERLYRD